jgi:hypothetical protein
MPMPQAGLSDKNKRFLRQFDDPGVLQRVHDLPDDCGRKSEARPRASPIKVLWESVTAGDVSLFET